MQMKEFKIEGMHCHNCVKHVTEALKSTKGILETTVSLEKNSAQVKIDESVFNINEAKLAVEDAGYMLIG
jgi:copper chaperone CopZ